MYKSDPIKLIEDGQFKYFLKIELDKFVLNTRSHFQAELQKGNVVHGHNLDRGLTINMAYNSIFNKIDELVEEEKKRA